MTDCSDVPARRTVSVAGAALAYQRWPGAVASTALLLHGITNSAGEFWRLAADLGGFSNLPGLPPPAIYALDLPGHGESDVSAGHHIDDVAAYVGGFIEALGLDQITLIGHSWGGAVSLALASGSHPARGRLARVALLDPATGIDPSWGAGLLPQYAARLGRPLAEVEAELRALNPDWHPCDLHWKLWALQRCRYAQVEGFFVGGGAWDLAPRLAEVSVPLLLLVADPERTVITPRRLAELRARLRPGLGRIEVIPGTGHDMLRGSSYAPTLAALANLGGS